MLTHEEREARMNLIGASEVGILFGVDRFANVEDLVRRKTGKLEPEEITNGPLLWGSLAEPAIQAGVNHLFGWSLYPGISYTAADCRLAANLDFEFLTAENDPKERPFPGCGDGAVEVKTMNGFLWRKLGGAPPLSYQLQVQAQMLCSGYAWGMIFVLVDGNHLHGPFLYEANWTLHGKIVKAVNAFWAKLDRGGFEIEPIPEELDATPGLGEERELDVFEREKLRDLAEEYFRFGKREKEWAAKKREVAKQIENIVDFHGKIDLEGAKISRFPVRGSREWKLVSRAPSTGLRVTRKLDKTKENGDE